MTFSCENQDDRLLIRCQVEKIGQEEMRDLENIVEDFPHENIILNLLLVRSIKAASVLNRLSNQRKKSEHSFIIVINQDIAEELDSELTIAQTMQEAWDQLENEEIERNLSS